MFEIFTVKNNDLPFIADSSNANALNKQIHDNSKDFRNILEEQKKVQKNVETNENKKNISQSKVCNRDEDLEKEEDVEKVEDKIKDVIDSIYQLVLTLKTNPEDFDKLDYESLKIKLDELSTILQQNSNGNNLLDIFKNDIQIFDNLLHTLEDNLNNGIQLNNEKIAEIPFTEILKEFDNIKEYLDLNHVKEANINFKDSILLDTSSNIANEEAIPNEMANTKELQINNETTLEVEAEATENSNVENKIVAIENSLELGKESQNLDVNPTAMEILTDNAPVNNLEMNTESFEQLDKQEIIKQIVDNIKYISQDNKQEIKIKLKPDILGDLVLKMEVKEGALMTKIIVDNYKTKELIETNLLQLKEEIQDNGLEIKTFEVFVGTNEDFERNSKEQFYFNKKQQKLKVKGNALGDLKAYDDSIITDRRQEVYYDGELNLFA